MKYHVYSNIANKKEYLQLSNSTSMTLSRREIHNTMERQNLIVDDDLWNKYKMDAFQEMMVLT